MKTLRLIFAVLAWCVAGAADSVPKSMTADRNTAALLWPSNFFTVNSNALNAVVGPSSYTTIWSDILRETNIVCLLWDDFNRPSTPATITSLGIPFHGPMWDQRTLGTASSGTNLYLTSGYMVLATNNDCNGYACAILGAQPIVQQAQVIFDDYGTGSEDSTVQLGMVSGVWYPTNSWAKSMMHLNFAPGFFKIAAYTNGVSTDLTGWATWSPWVTNTTYTVRWVNDTNYGVSRLYVDGVLVGGATNDMIKYLSGPFCYWQIKADAGGPWRYGTRIDSAAAYARGPVVPLIWSGGTGATNAAGARANLELSGSATNVAGWATTSDSATARTQLGFGALTYVWPVSQSASTYLKNDGSGTLSWSAASISTAGAWGDVISQTNAACLLYDDFERTATTWSEIGGPVVGPAWDIRGAGSSVVGASICIDSGELRHTTNRNSNCYMCAQLLSRPVIQQAVIKWYDLGDTNTASSANIGLVQGMGDPIVQGTWFGTMLHTMIGNGTTKIQAWTNTSPGVNVAYDLTAWVAWPGGVTWATNTSFDVRQYTDTNNGIAQIWINDVLVNAATNARVKYVCGPNCYWQIFFEGASTYYRWDPRFDKVAAYGKAPGVVPIVYGGSAATNAAGARSNFGLTAASTNTAVWTTTSDAATARSALGIEPSYQGSVTNQTNYYPTVFLDWSLGGVLKIGDGGHTFSQVKPAGESGTLGMFDDIGNPMTVLQSTNQLLTPATADFRYVRQNNKATNVDLILPTWDGNQFSEAATNIAGWVTTSDAPTARAALAAASETSVVYTNVLDFGAVPDGVTDCTEAIQTATATGRRIYFPYGTYVLSSCSISNQPMVDWYGPDATLIRAPDTMTGARTKTCTVVSTNWETQSGSIGNYYVKLLWAGADANDGPAGSNVTFQSGVNRWCIVTNTTVPALDGLYQMSYFTNYSGNNWYLYIIGDNDWYGLGATVTVTTGPAKPWVRFKSCTDIRIEMGTVDGRSWYGDGGPGVWNFDESPAELGWAMFYVEPTNGYNGDIVVKNTTFQRPTKRSGWFEIYSPTAANYHEARFENCKFINCGQYSCVSVHAATNSLFAGNWVQNGDASDGWFGAYGTSFIDGNINSYQVHYAWAFSVSGTATRTLNTAEWKDNICYYTGLGRSGYVNSDRLVNNTIRYRNIKPSGKEDWSYVFKWDDGPLLDAYVENLREYSPGTAETAGSFIARDRTTYTSSLGPITLVDSYVDDNFYAADSNPYINGPWLFRNCKFDSTATADQIVLPTMSIVQGGLLTGSQALGSGPISCTIDGLHVVDNYVSLYATGDQTIRNSTFYRTSNGNGISFASTPTGRFVIENNRKIEGSYKVYLYQSGADRRFNGILRNNLLDWNSASAATLMFSPYTTVDKDFTSIEKLPRYVSTESYTTNLAVPYTELVGRYFALTFQTTLPTDGATFTIGGTDVRTWKTSVTQPTNQILIGADRTACALNCGTHFCTYPARTYPFVNVSGYYVYFNFAPGSSLAITNSSATWCTIAYSTNLYNIPTTAMRTPNLGRTYADILHRSDSGYSGRTNGIVDLWIDQGDKVSPEAGIFDTVNGSTILGGTLTRFQMLDGKWREYGPRWAGSGAPGHYGAIGSIYSRRDGNTNTALYANADGTTNGWKSVLLTGGLGELNTAGIGVLTVTNDATAANLNATTAVNAAALVVTNTATCGGNNLMRWRGVVGAGDGAPASLIGGDMYLSNVTVYVSDGTNSIPLN